MLSPPHHLFVSMILGVCKSLGETLWDYRLVMEVADEQLA